MKVLPWAKYEKIEAKIIAKLLFNAGILSPKLDCDAIVTNLAVVVKNDVLVYPDFDVIYIYAEKISQNNDLSPYPECINNNYVVKNPNLNISDYIKFEFVYTRNGNIKGRKIGSCKKDTTFYNERLASFREKNGDFPDDIKAQFIPDQQKDLSLEVKKELYSVTIEAICNKFMEDNAELVKTPPKNWLNKLYVTIKKNIPKIDFKKDIELLSYVYDIYTDMCFNLAVTPSINGFCIMSGLHWYTFKEWVQNRQRLSPEYNSFIKKALYSTENNLVNSLIVSPGSNTNTMFLLNTVYGYDKKTTVEHITTMSDQKTIEDIPILEDMNG